MFKRKKMDVIRFHESKGSEGPVLIIPDIYEDERGYFFESYNEEKFREMVADVKFVQDNESKSSYGVLRGLHFQKPPYAQAKLVRVVSGAVIDVVADLRKDSETYGLFYYAFLSAKNHRQFFVPRGFAHGFVTLMDNTIFQYKCDNLYNKESEGAVAWDDPVIAIPWNQWIDIKDAILSPKDKLHKPLKEIENPF